MADQQPAQRAPASAPAGAAKPWPQPTHRGGKTRSRSSPVARRRLGEIMAEFSRSASARKPRPDWFTFPEFTLA